MSGRLFLAKKKREEPSTMNPNAHGMDILPGATRASVKLSRINAWSIPRFRLKKHSARVSKPIKATSSAQICPHRPCFGLDSTELVGIRNSQSDKPATIKQNAVFGFIVV